MGVGKVWLGKGVRKEKREKRKKKKEKRKDNGTRENETKKFTFSETLNQNKNSF